MEDILLCMPILGYSFFERAPVAKSKTRRYSLSSKGLSAEGYESSEGFVVAKGSQVSWDERPSIHGYLKELRAALIKEGVLQAAGSVYTLTGLHLRQPEHSGRRGGGRGCQWSGAVEDEGWDDVEAGSGGFSHLMIPIDPNDSTAIVGQMR